MKKYLVLLFLSIVCVKSSFGMTKFSRLQVKKAQNDLREEASLYCKGKGLPSCEFCGKGKVPDFMLMKNINQGINPLPVIFICFCKEHSDKIKRECSQ